MSNDNFSDRLLSLEQTTPAFREKYEREVKTMLEKTLNPIQRFVFIFTTVLALAMTMFFAYVALILARELPILIRASFGIGALFAAAWAILSIKILRAGKINLRAHPNAMTGMTWGFLVIFITIMMLVTGKHPQSVLSVYMLLNALVFFIGGVASLITNRIEQSELNMKEKLLGIELRLAELSEKMEK